MSTVVNFYTIGLPRSRSLWLSKLLSYGDSTCFHEALSSHGVHSLPEVDTTYRGFCDTNPLQAPAYDGPVLKVTRAREDTIRSILNKFDCPEGVVSYQDFAENYWQVYADALAEIDAGMTVDVADLSDPKVVDRICRYLMPDNPVPAAWIDEMIATRIETVNRDLSGALRHTAQSEGVQYDEYIARFDKPTYRVWRCFDSSIALAVMQAMWDEVSEDGCDDYLPDVVNEHWLSVARGHTFIGMCRIHQHTSVLWEIHAFILPNHRGNSIGAGTEALRYAREHCEGRLIVTVPECFENVIKYVKALGFEQQGYSPKSYRKNGLVGLVQLGMSIEGIK